ncbi:hypothetical protein [Actinoplanes sp. NPDC049316]|uniref:hypothetical protein n=1 Tax=Actinoplanes sp. NPDC049316 TaxID=3154727 RepID=UPI00341E221C
MRTAVTEAVPDDAAPPAPRDRRRRLDGRTRAILAAAAVTAAVVNAGAVWAYWTITDAGAAIVEPGTYVSMALRGRSSLDTPLQPGATGPLTVTVSNDNPYPIVVSSVEPGPGNVVADDEHREAGCRRPAVSFARSSLSVRWQVSRNDVAVFTVPDALRMAADEKAACAGGVFTVPVQVTGHVDRI